MASFLREAPVKRLYHVRYEDLVANPEQELRNICSIADLPYTDDLVNYGEKEVDGTGLGDPIGVQQHKRPTTASVHKWAENVAGNDERVAMLQKMLEPLLSEDLEQLGYPRDALFEPLDSVDPEKAKKAQSAAKKWDRHHLQRRTLLHLRRGIHGNVLGRTLSRVRFYCDVLLRE